MDFFTSKRRFVYMSPGPGEQPSGESIAQTAKEKLAQQPAEIEKQLKASEVSAEDATKQSYGRIEEIINTAYGNLEGTGTDDEIKQLRADIEAARKAASKKIEENAERYAQIASFVKKRTEIELTLEKNAQGFDEMKKSSEPSFLVALHVTIDGLGTNIDDVNGLNPPDMEADKTALIQKIEDQKKAFQQRVDELHAFHDTKIDSYDTILKDVQDVMDAGEAPNMGYFDAIGKHSTYLASIAHYLSDTPPEAALVEKALAKSEEFDPIILKARESFIAYASAQSPEYKKLDEEAKRLELNQRRAYENLARVQVDPNATPLDRKNARGWLEGANQVWSKKMEERNALGREIDRKRSVPIRFGEMVEQMPEEEGDVDKIAEAEEEGGEESQPT